MGNEVAKSLSVADRVLVQGDLSQLSEQDRITYYAKVCESLGLNPLTKPFDYIKLSGKLTLYAKKDCADQLRKKDKISVNIIDRREVDGIYEVLAHAKTPDGREDEDMGAVSIKGLSGDTLVNAKLKAVTKAKRRVTLSICGLGMLDESEIETIHDAEPHHHSVSPPKQIEHQPKNGNGHHEEKKPPTGADLEAGIKATEAAWVEQKLCRPGELFQALAAWAKDKGCMKAIGSWPPELAAQVREKMMELKKRWWTEAQARKPAPQNLLDEIDRQADILGWTEDELNQHIAQQHKIAKGTVLTEQQAQAIVLDLQQIARDGETAGASNQSGGQTDTTDIPF